MKKEDKEFLKELQHELNTQTTDGNANPVFWGIMERKEVRVPDGEGDTAYFHMDDEVYNLDEVVGLIEDFFKEGFDWSGRLTKEQYENAYDEWTDEFQEEMHDDAVYIEDFMRNCLHWSFYTFESEEQDILSENTGAFLTKRAAKEYIEKFGYNHSNPRTYAMTAFRNFELERLLIILKTMNVDDIKED